jgi:hypothetical protein
MCVLKSGDINEEEFDGFRKLQDSTVVSVDPVGGLLNMSLGYASISDKAVFIVRSIEEYIKICYVCCSVMVDGFYRFHTKIQVTQ